MKILQNTNDLTLIINTEQSFKTDAGWQDNLQELEDETLKKIINPIENYETVRYVHKPYTSNNGVLQTDIWFYFNFLSGSTYVKDYSPTGLTPKENALMLKQSTESFFRLEFYKTPNNEPPERTNRRMVFAKNLSLPLGEKYFYTTLNHYIFQPVFMGSNYRNKENMYLFWFQDESTFDETTLTGNTFFMTARYFNAKDGTISDFTSTGLTSQEVVEYRDMYYQMDIDKTDYSYQIFKYNGVKGNRIGESDDPINFYEKRT